MSLEQTHVETENVKIIYGTCNQSIKLALLMQMKYVTLRIFFVFPKFCVWVNLVAPTKALCNEIFGIWQVKFAAFGLNVALATGDSDPAEMVDLSDLSANQIVITTPEKCDAMTRRWKDQYEIAQAVRLVLIDEVQLVGDTCRGPTLEAIVSRIKTFPMNRQIRFVSVSASLPNIEDIAQWLGAEQPADSVRTYQ